jgi:glycine/D-amino acid oxidase-like deaminating enzyme
MDHLLQECNMTQNGWKPGTKLAGTPAMRVGVIGLGHIGGAFARNLLADGYDVVALDRDPRRVAELRDTGAGGTSQLADLSACDVIVRPLPDDNALRSVALEEGGLLDVMRPGSIHVSISTVSPNLARQLEDAHASGRQDLRRRTGSRQSRFRAQPPALYSCGGASASGHAS